jgi:hypothetical protein
VVHDDAARLAGENRRQLVRHGRSTSFWMADVMVPSDLFQKILAAVAALRP